MVTAFTGKDHYQTQLTATGHRLVADEPEEIGGGNLGPSPGQFLQLALASCTSITLRMYASRKNFPLDSVRVEVNSEREGEETIFQRHIYLEGPLDGDQRERLLQIANGCPVHKTLTHSIRIESSLK